MNLEVARMIIDNSMTDEELSILMLKAETMAVNYHWWKSDDIPTDEEKKTFTDKYQFEICDIAKAMRSDVSRDGLVSYSELGVTRQWGESGDTTVQKSLSKIPRKAYVI